MKLNGALKPRHGASIAGSSPGAEQLRKYRDKPCPKDTSRHVDNGCLFQQGRHQPQQQFNESDVNSNNSNYNNISSNKIIDNNQQRLKEQQQEQPQQTQQPPQPPQQLRRRHRKQCVESILRSSQEVITDLSNNNSTQTRIKSFAAARTTTIIEYISHGSGKAPPTATGATEPATEAAAKEQTGGSGNHDNDGVIKLKQQQQQSNITTRQTSNSNSDTPHLSKQVKEHAGNTRVGEEFPIANCHVITPDKGATWHKRNYTTTTILRSYCWKEVNKLSFIWKINEPLFGCAITSSTTVIIFRLFKAFESFLLWLTFLMFSNGNPVGGNGCSGMDYGSSRCFGAVRFTTSLATIMRASQSFTADPLDRICLKNANKSRLPLITIPPSFALRLLFFGAAAIMLLPQPVLADDGDNFFSPNGIAIGESTTEFDYASRGQKKFGDKCDNTLECGFPGSICDAKKKSCQCTEDLPVTNHIDKCGKEAAVNESCFFNEQCEVKYFQTECRDGRCVCRFDMTPIWLKDGTVECKGRQDKKGPETYIDPAMIGVLIGMALMFIIICVVLRLFSQARWRENRTIFNTPNPRLMNVSLLRESKLLHGQERRGSRMSVRAPSRQPSMASLRPHSPNPSLGSRSNSHGSNASATSLRSTRSNSVSPAINNTHHERKGSTYHPQHQQHHQQPHHPPPPPASVQQQQQLQQPNIIANPVAESVTVEIIEPEK